MNLDETVSVLLHELTPEPPREVSVADIARRVRQTAEAKTWYRRPWVAALTAAVIVIAVAAVVVGVRDRWAHHAPAVAPTPTATSAVPTPTPAPSVVNGIHAPSCRAQQLDPFTNALKPVITTAPGGGYDLAGLPILSITADGDVLVGTQGDGANPARLDLVSPDGARTTLYRTSGLPLAAGEVSDFAAAQGDARWIVFGLYVGQPGRGTLSRLGVIDRASGAVTTFRTLPTRSTTIVQAPVLYQGRAYWSEVDGGGTGAIFSYDPATRSTVTVDRGAHLGWPTVIGGGLYWQRDGRVIAYRPGRLPRGFPLSTTKFPRMATDGDVTVWVTTAQTNGTNSVKLVLSTPDMATPLILADSTTASTLVPLAVAGPYVIWDDGQGFTALDTRTGATATVGNTQPGFSTIATGGGTIAINQIGSKGGAQLSVGRISTLPKLTC